MPWLIRFSVSFSTCATRGVEYYFPGFGNGLLLIPSQSFARNLLFFFVGIGQIFLYWLYRIYQWKFFILGTLGVEPFLSAPAKQPVF